MNFLYNVFQHFYSNMIQIQPNQQDQPIYNVLLIIIFVILYNNIILEITFCFIALNNWLNISSFFWCALISSSLELSWSNDQHSSNTFLKNLTSNNNCIAPFSDTFVKISTSNVKAWYFSNISRDNFVKSSLIII